jgi:CHAD domain-containing protein
MVRDLDVQLEALDAWAVTPDAGPSGAEAPTSQALRPFRDDLAVRRDEARRDLIDLLDSRRYQDFVNDYLEFTETPGAAEQAAPPGSPVQVRHTAGGRIWSAYEHLRAHEAILGWADIPALHAVRIDAKRLRYTLESFREVLPAATTDLIAKVTTLQDHLGMLNDADIAARLVREHLMANAPRLSGSSQAVLSSYLASREAIVAATRRGLSTQWRPITAPTTRRVVASIIAAT